jgi:hypothetical protein
MIEAWLLALLLVPAPALSEPAERELTIARDAVIILDGKLIAFADVPEEMHVVDVGYDANGEVGWLFLTKEKTNHD